MKKTTMAKRVEIARKRKGLSQWELSQLAGLDPSTVHKIETRNSDRVFGTTIIKLAKALEVDAMWLMTGNRP